MAFIPNLISLCHGNMDKLNETYFSFTKFYNNKKSEIFKIKVHGENLYAN